MDRKECIIKYGRVWFCIFVIVEVIAASILFEIQEHLWLDSTNEKNKVGQDLKVFSFIFFGMSALLFANTFWLISRLKKKNQSGADGNSIFSREICTLWIILSVFSGTYTLRGIWDNVIGTNYENRFKFQLIGNLLNILWDFVPVTLILMLHMKNFVENKQRGIDV